MFKVKYKIEYDEGYKGYFIFKKTFMFWNVLAFRGTQLEAEAYLESIKNF